MMKKCFAMMMAALLLLLSACGVSEQEKASYTQIDQETAKTMMAADDGHIIVDVTVSRERPTP